MPPFKTGLLKRKIDSTTQDKNSKDSKESNSSSEEEDLIRGELNIEGDATDSEHEEHSTSDGEIDEVVFDDSADSLLEDNQSGQSAEESSELTDDEDDSGDSDDSKEPDGSTRSNNEDSIDEIQAGDGTKLNNDSGTETAPTASVSGSSDESIQNLHLKKKKQNLKQKYGNNKNKMSSIDVLVDKIKETKVATEPVQQKDEYESGDSSDEEDRRNTVGEVPAWWYDEYPHVGYDLDGRRLLRPPQRDRIDDFLKQCEDPDFWRTVRDAATGQDVVLSADDLQLLRRLRASRPPADSDAHEPWVEWFSREVMATPLRAFPDHKRSFVPSRDEQRAVGRLVHALKMGWTKTRRQLARDRRAARERQFYDLWGSGPQRDRAGPRPIAAPRRPPPTHAESYNPPPEFLLDRKEMKEWEALSATPWKRKHSFLPARHAGLRAVPAYARFVRERFLRCLDLYLAPRAIKMRLTIGAEDLLPKLPAPRDLRPFPTAEALRLRGHAGAVRGLDFDPSGQYIASASDDGTVKLWETHTGRCVRTLALGEPVRGVWWAPAAGLGLLCAAAGARLLLLSPGPGVGDARVARRTDELLARPLERRSAADARTAAAVRWEEVDAAGWARGERLALTHFRPVTGAAWHARADYVCVTLEDAASRAVLVHQVSRRASQLPFRRAKGLVQCALFHPREPQLFVATQRAVRLYDLVRQELVRKLQTGAQWISAMAVHPAGDNLLVASYDRKLVWFDLELSARPYQTLRLHGGAVRGVAFHPRYPLFASGGDDPYLVVSHGMVYNSLLQSPLLVPLKQLPGPARGAHCVLAVRWHPAQPWLLAAGADHTLRLYT